MSCSSKHLFVQYVYCLFTPFNNKSSLNRLVNKSDYPLWLPACTLGSCFECLSCNNWGIWFWLLHVSRHIMSHFTCCKPGQNQTCRDRLFADLCSCWHLRPLPSLTFVYSSSIFTELKLMGGWQPEKKGCLRKSLIVLTHFCYLCRNWQMILSLLWAEPPERTSVRVLLVSFELVVKIS